MPTPPLITRTGRVQSWIDSPGDRLPVSCTVFVVDDSMEGPNGIEASWRFVSHALRYGAGCAVHLSNLRPAGEENGRGLVASGPLSFAKIYSVLNEILRRGGRYKNGAVTLHLTWDHPDLGDRTINGRLVRGFLNTPRSELPWVKRCVDVPADPSWIQELEYRGLLQPLLKAIARGDVWLNKIKHDKNGNRLYGNVCVSGDTIVHTTEGPRQAKELVGRPFVALINGEEHPSSDRGFWSNGLRQTVTVETQEGFEVRVTWDHKMQTTRGMVKASELLEGDKLVLTDARKGIPEWGGPGSFDEGWLLGWLLADGTFSDDATAKLDFYGSKKELLQDALFRLEAQDCRLDRVTSQRVGCLSEGADRTSVSSRGLARLAEEYGVTRSSKNATAALGQTSSRFAQGFLQAYMEADGCVCLGTKKGAGRSLQVTSIWRRNLLLMQQMLLRLGIRSRVWSGLNDKDVSMPDGKGGQALYRSKPAFRLDISGAHDIFRYRDLIGFTLPDKAEKLEALVASYRKVYKPKPMVARVQNVTPFDYEEVYDCSIPSLGVFEANGIIVSNCLEVFLESRGTCLLLHENLGACTIADIAPGMVQGMKELLELHPRTGVGESGEYLKPAEDRQVGLGLLGLANLLAQEGVTYRQLADALEEFLGDNEKKPVSRYSATAMAIVRALSQGITQSAALARAAGMERAFCIAPTATCSYKSRDLRGYACAPEIAPPVARHVDRDSGTFGVETVAYPPDIEIAKEVGYDTFRRVADGIVRLFEETGLFHGYSLNSWSDEVTYDRDFIENWAQSPQTSLYYSLQVAPDTQAKDSVAVASSDESGVGAEIFGFDDEEPAAACSMDSPGFCSACAE